MCFNFCTLKGFNSHINSTRSHTHSPTPQQQQQQIQNSEHRNSDQFTMNNFDHSFHHENLKECMMKFKMNHEWLDAWNVMYFFFLLFCFFTDLGIHWIHNFWISVCFIICGYIIIICCCFLFILCLALLLACHRVMFYTFDFLFLNFNSLFYFNSLSLLVFLYILLIVFRFSSKLVASFEFFLMILFIWKYI